MLCYVVLNYILVGCPWVSAQLRRWNNWIRMRPSPFSSNWPGATWNLWVAKKFERLRSQFSATFQLASPLSNKGGGKPERQGSNRFRLAKTTTLHVHYSTFLCRRCTTTISQPEMKKNVSAFPRLRPLFKLETMKFVRLYTLSVFTSATLDSASYKFTSKNSIATLTCSSIAPFPMRVLGYRQESFSHRRLQ